MFAVEFRRVLFRSKQFVNKREFRRHMTICGSLLFENDNFHIFR